MPLLTLLTNAVRARGDRAVYVHGAEHAQRADRSPLLRRALNLPEWIVAGRTLAAAAVTASPVAAEVWGAGAPSCWRCSGAHGGHTLSAAVGTVSGWLHQGGGWRHHGGARSFSVRPPWRPPDGPAPVAGAPRRGLARARHVQVFLWRDNHLAMVGSLVSSALGACGSGPGARHPDFHRPGHRPGSGCPVIGASTRLREALPHLTARTRNPEQAAPARRLNRRTRSERGDGPPLISRAAVDRPRIAP